jgi:hypothetical protein
VRARYAALCTELKPFPAAFPGNGSWNAGNVPARTARIWVLAAASPSIAPVCTDT